MLPPSSNDLRCGGDWDFNVLSHSALTRSFLVSDCLLDCAVDEDDS